MVDAGAVVGSLRSMPFLRPPVTSYRPRLTGRWRYPAALVIVGSSAVVADFFYRLTGSSRLSSIFLAGILISAFLLGSGPAYLATGAAFVTYLYLVDPRYQFSFGSPEDFNVLALFLAVATLAGALIGRIREDANRAETRARLTAALLSATREFSDLSELAPIRDRLADHLAAAADGAAFVHDGTMLVWRGGSPQDEVREAARKAAERDSVEAPPGWRFRRFREENANYVLGWRAPVLTSDEAAFIEILADTGAAALARARLAEAKAAAESRARTEDLRNALLSSISHDIRTPLAAILGSASSLSEYGESFDEGTRKDLATTIQEEALRLDAFVANLLNMSRLEAGALAVQTSPFSVAEVVRRTVERRTRQTPRSVLVSIDPHISDGLGDPALFEQALGNVVENALRHTPARVGVRVCARATGERILVEVSDEGDGVPEGDLERIFQKFYRSDAAAERPGTGLGLAIAKGLVEGMGGAVRARNLPGAGLAVTLELPKAPE